MAQIYRFGPFTLDVARRRLVRGDGPVVIPPKALDVLEVLLEHRGRTVEKADLMARVWPDTVVEESNLTQSVFMLRKALEDDPAAPQYISTIARRGYRFVGDATAVSGDHRATDPGHVHGTRNIEAHHAYLRGRHYWLKRDADSLRGAIRWFRRAIDLDPVYALAYVGLAECFVILRMLGWPTEPDALVTAKAAVARALEIDDALAEAHASLGVLCMTVDRDPVAAERSFQRAIQLAPAYPTAHNWYANFLAAQGRFDAAILEARHAVTLDPLSVVWRMGVGHMLLLARRYEDAREAELAALDIEPRFALAHWVLGMTYEGLGDAAAAVQALRQADEYSGGNVLIRGSLGRILALSGHVAEARAILGELAERHAPPQEAIGLVHAGLGEAEQAFDALASAAREGSYLLTLLRVSPLFDSLRVHPRFEAFQRLV